MASMQFVFLLILLISSHSMARQLDKMTPLQQTISKCFKKQIDVKGLHNLKNIYDFVAKKNLLIASSVISREVLYKVKDETRKLKYENSQLTIYKVSNEPNQSLIQLNNEVRQKSLTVESYLNQLLLQADIRSDFLKTKETRVNSTTVFISWQDSEIKNLTIESGHLQKKLECGLLEQSVVCSCFELK